MKELTQNIKLLTNRVRNYNGEDVLKFYPDLFANIFQQEAVTTENDLAELAVKNTELRVLIDSLFDAIIFVFQSRRFIWIDCETQAGQAIATKLALNRKEDVALLTRFVNNCEIDHEVHLFETIIDVWNKWGYTSETNDLVISFALISQNGIELLDSLCSEENSFSGLMKQKEHANKFLAGINQWLSIADGSWNREIQKADLEFVTEILSDAFATVFDLEEEDAGTAAEKFMELHEKGKTPTARIIPRKNRMISAVL